MSVTCPLFHYSYYLTTNSLFFPFLIHSYQHDNHEDNNSYQHDSVQLRILPYKTTVSDSLRQFYI